MIIEDLQIDQRHIRYRDQELRRGNSVVGRTVLY
jgi:hypothetical protein